MKIPNCLTSKTPLLYKAFYFVFYAGYISFLLYIPVYFKYLGLSAIYVGLLNGIRPLMQTVGAPLWGVIGDRFRIRKIIFVFAFVVMTVKTMMFAVFRPENTVCLVTYFNSSGNILRNETYVVKHHIIKRWASHETTNDNVPLNITNNFTHIKIDNMNIGQRKRNEEKEFDPKSSSADERILVKNYNDHSEHYSLIYDDEESTRIFLWILILVVCGDAFDAAVFTLADTSCLDILGGENYGYYRLWGSAGWGVMSPVIGFAITHITHDYCGSKAGSYFIIFYFYLGFMYLGLLFGSHFEFSYNHNDHVHQTVKSALLNFHYGIFLFVTFYAGVCYGFLLYFVNWFIDSLGGTAIVMGTASACKSIMDVLGFFLAGRIIDVFGHLNTVTISLIAYIGSFVSYSYLTEPWYAVPIEILHAGAYALVWSASVLYLNKAAPAGSSATVQGILQGVYWGMGTGGGTIVGGYVVHVFGFRSTFRGFAVVTGVVLAVFLTTQFISKYSRDLVNEMKEWNKVENEEDQNKDEDDISKPTPPVQWTSPLEADQNAKSASQKEETLETKDTPVKTELYDIRSNPPPENPENLENTGQKELPEDTAKLMEEN